MNIHAQRLLNVVRALRESPNPGKFTMGQYTHPCGTPGCALGNYAARSDLQDVLTIDRTHFRAVDAGMFYVPVILEHFNINEDERTELFGDEGCGNANTPEAAARYIEAFVAKKYSGEKPARDEAAFAVFMAGIKQRVLVLA